MKRTISAGDANQRFSELLRAVQEGESFVVTSRGRPVAKVTPVDDLDRQRPAIDTLLDFVAGLPRRRLQAWRRESLYE
ncbi:type II toxin-antitoxin system Phd/YefM family antitoxin [Phenylobacterium sp.]|uniref:type II toxin-antitoxin system Phd/YefM family antitoxin n=1 Tax=Phenylobacterium sp. TaxID=1871053 RepID=UPI0025CBEC27|nr:type II toxin-antitoxin system Phd/YefM family antitoxin [Phenylobacterium sp.]MBX3484101.1 type II toxin-antitoxin system Phd/YefM family antitoxin [Phenylobacterium sp.]